MNIATRDLNFNLIHPELEYCRHVMRFPRFYNCDEVLERCRYARMNGDTQDVRLADELERAALAHQFTSTSDSDPAWTRAAFVILLVMGVSVFGGILAWHGAAAAQKHPTVCATLTADECTAYAQGGW